MITLVPRGRRMMAVAARAYQRQRGWRAGCRLARANTGAPPGTRTPNPRI